MTAKPAPLLIVLVSVLLSVSLSLMLDRTGTVEGRTASASTEGDTAEGTAHRALDERLSALENQLQRDDVELLPPPLAFEASSGATVNRTTLANEADLEDVLDARLSALETRLARLESDASRAPRDESVSKEEEQRVRAEAIDDAKRILADPRTTVAEKLAAHEALRRVENAYTPAMVQQLARIGLGDPDPSVRSNVWRCFDGSSLLPELVPDLLRALSKDVDASVRNEAAETLGNYLYEPDVLAALQASAEYDESPKVRQKAARTLAEWKGIATPNR